MLQGENIASFMRSAIHIPTPNSAVISVESVFPPFEGIFSRADAEKYSLIWIMITYKSPRRGEYTISAPRTIFRNPRVCIIINRALLPSNGAFEGRSTIPSCFIGWLKIALCEYKGGNNPRMFTREFIDRTYSETSAQNPPITITSISRSINILKFCPKRGYFETL